MFVIVWMRIRLKLVREVVGAAPVGSPSAVGSYCTGCRLRTRSDAAITEYGKCYISPSITHSVSAISEKNIGRLFSFGSEKANNLHNAE
jgi:hypothetical protein